ncbi:hypothetical protein BOTBODRAFT_38996 [Botryobasidium botryosum FD-172 SS1]|uniref:Peptidase A1 domain-containing protein n=1 Tax=Botryobasidium botryosum (strain FD-172 SS1) TaxID=930990 RepID=A0A067M5K0_BOTB1|nr:hypothetical protein BOTBODRAFT_38996 [Botryobasidium botryosum FD-172 SS1]
MSSTYQPYVEGQKNVSLGSGGITGITAKETCALKTDSGGWWDYANQTIVVASDGISGYSGTAVGSGSGIVGLGLSAAQTMSDSILGQYLYANDDDAYVSVGLALNDNSDSAANGGEMHLLAPDPTAYQGDISLVNVVNLSDTQQPPVAASTDWAFPITSWNFSIPGGQYVSASGGVAMVEVYLPEIVVPFSVAPSIFNLVNSSRLTRIDRNSTVWAIPCDSKFQLALSVGSVTFALSERELVVKNGTACESAIRSWLDPAMSTYLFGNTLLRQSYIVFSASRNGIGHSKLGFANRSTHNPHTQKIGIIVGAVVGGVALLALLIGGIFLFLRWRNRDRTAPSTQFNQDVLGNPAAPGTLGPAAPLTWTPYDPRQASNYTPPESRRQSQAGHRDSYFIPPQNAPVGAGHMQPYNNPVSAQSQAATSPRGSVNMWVTSLSPNATD